jgi:hypothetical protein
VFLLCVRGPETTAQGRVDQSAAIGRRHAHSHLKGGNGLFASKGGPEIETGAGAVFITGHQLAVSNDIRHRHAGQSSIS